ncbi:MAG TPA: methyl-accepting chemotaxis protein [Pseudolabrys sp.]|nr:methyl-accepting chemotaxis protein [Pseudolabrys sp.]
MRQFTIAERVIAAALLPLVAMLVAAWLSARLSPFFGATGATYAQAAFWLAAGGLAAVAIAKISREISSALVDATDAIDAIAYAELQSASNLPPERGEVARLIAASDRLAEVLGERQRRELVHIDLDRTWQASRRFNLSNLAQQVEAATEAGMRPIAEGSAAVLVKAEDMLTALESVHAAFDETMRASEGARTMNRAAGDLSDQVMQAIAEISELVRRGGGVGHDAVARANAARSTIDALTRAANQIGDIVGVINQIAEQTNLLALNATIEAARAGEAGRGFSVVASEVKTLATQTGKSSGQIGAKVAEIQSTTREVVASLTSVAEAIDQLSGVTASVSTAIEQQRSATESFAASARETSAAASDVASRMAGIVDMVQRSRSTALDVSVVAASMESTSQTLCREIPDIVRNAVTEDLREFPRYAVNLVARVEHEDLSFDVAVQDISEGGVRIATEANLAVGDRLAMTLPGMKTIAGEVARRGNANYGVCFVPARLRLEELRDLVTAKDRAA